MKENRRDPVTPIPESVTYRENQFEHCLTYRTDAGSVKEMALIHIPGSAQLVLGMATFGPEQDEPVAMLEFGTEETRLRYEFLAKMKELGLLDES